MGVGEAAQPNMVELGLDGETMGILRLCEKPSIRNPMAPLNV